MPLFFDFGGLFIFGLFFRLGYVSRYDDETSIIFWTLRDNMKYMCLLWFWMLEFCGRWILDFWMNTQNEERKVKDRILRRLSFSHTATAQHAPQLDTHGSKAIAHFCPKLPYILGAQLRQKTQSYYNWSGGMGLQEYHQKKEIYRLKCVWEAVGARKEPINFYHIKFSFILFLSFPFFSIFSDHFLK